MPSGAYVVWFLLKQFVWSADIGEKKIVSLDIRFFVNHLLVAAAATMLCAVNVAEHLGQQLLPCHYGPTKRRCRFAMGWFYLAKWAVKIYMRLPQHVDEKD